MSTCAGTKRNGEPCTLPAMAGSEWCWNHDPDRAEERKRNAIRAATLKHSKIGQEIRDVRHTVKEVVFVTLSNELHPTVRKNLQNLIQLLQIYARLAELEIAAEEKPRKDDVSLPESTKEQVREWVEDEEAKAREREELVEDLSQAMKAHGYDPAPLQG
jgi:hypothetical protein